MDERKRLILQAIVQDYIKTAEPVGSRTLAKNYNLGISPATVRNEMADLEDLGFLEQPHTSAGRIPSSKGYRYYVNSLMEDDVALEEDKALIGRLWREYEGETQNFFYEVAKVISKISRNVSFFLAPANDDSTIKHVHMLPINPHHAVLVVVTSTGALDNEPLQFPELLEEATLAQYERSFSDLVCGTPIGKITLENFKVIEHQIPIPKLFRDVIIEGLCRAIVKRKLFYTIGTTSLLDQPEFQDNKQIQSLLSLLEKQEKLGELIKSNSAETIDIKIGEETELVKNMSVITTSFSQGHQHLGTLAILGPTRMEYKRLISILMYMHQFIDSVRETR